MAAYLLFNGSNLALQANEYDEKSNRKAHLHEMKKKVADLRAKAADLKSHGKHQAAEAVIHESNELYQQFKSQSKVFERRMNRDQHAMEELMG